MFQVLSRLLLSVCLVMGPSISMAEDKQDIQQRFKQVELSDFFKENQISEKLAAEKKRVMLPPEAVQFKARLMSPPKPGQFSLVYDALGLWGREDSSSDERPEVTHSAFIGSESGPVLGMYLSSAAAKQLVPLEVGSDLTVYAVHLYNYAGGPRLVVLGAEPAGRVD